MRIAEFNKNQFRSWQVFHLLLDEAGWEDVHGTEAKIRSGALASPEGHFRHVNREVSLNLSLYLPVQLVTLEIRELYGNRGHVLHIFFEGGPDQILEWIVANRSGFALEKVEDMVQPLVNHADLTLLELGEDHILPLEKNN